MSLQVVSWLGVALVSFGCAVFGASLGEVNVDARWLLGRRGLERARLLRGELLFAAVEPCVRWLARPIHKLPLHALRTTLTAQLRHSGDFMGLSPDELLAFGWVASVVSCVAGFAVRSALNLSLVAPLIAACAGPLWIGLAMGARKRMRAQQVDRGLPAVIDLAALCMGAGLDFSGSIRLVIEEVGATAGTLRDELRMVLRAVEVGATRSQALRDFAERVPTRSVQDFVSAVVQAEQKGTPLASVLRIQATTLRSRRSVLAEEAAARAGVLMMLPLMLLLACVMLIAMGGMVIRGMEAGL